MTKIPDSMNLNEGEELYRDITFGERIKRSDIEEEHAYGAAMVPDEDEQHMEDALPPAKEAVNERYVADFHESLEEADQIGDPTLMMEAEQAYMQNESPSDSSKDA